MGTWMTIDRTLDDNRRAQTRQALTGVVQSRAHPAVPSAGDGAVNSNRRRLDVPVIPIRPSADLRAPNPETRVPSPDSRAPRPDSGPTVTRPSSGVRVR